jgi:hypothetical protein
MKNIYPAGPFSWQGRILGYADRLAAIGYTITAEWLHQKQQFTSSDNKTLIYTSLHSECQNFSERDLFNIASADTLILFDPGIPMERNTRIAEFGAALAWGKKCIVIGPEEEDKKDVISSIFVHLQDVGAFKHGGKYDTRLSHLRAIQPVTRYQTFNLFMKDILDPEKVECCAGCGTEYRVRDCGCPAGSFYTWKTKGSNYEVLPSPLVSA